MYCFYVKNPPKRIALWDRENSQLHQILLRLTLVVLNVYLFLCRLDEISGAASKEFGLEKAMEKMKVEWKDMYFEFIPYRDTVSGQRAVYEDGHNYEESFANPYNSLSFFSSLPIPLLELYVSE